MERVLERLPAGARISVVRLRSLGDCVLTTPALQLLKTYRPDLELAVVVEDRFRDIFGGNPAVSRILRPTVPEIANFRSDLCINFHGGTRSVVLTLASAARLRAGFIHYRAQTAYNIRIPRAQQILGEERVVHTAEHLASAMFHLGVPRREIPRAQLFSDAPTTRAGYSVIHPFASAPAKAWPVERFVEAANHLRDASLPPVILAGPGDDTSAFEGFDIAHALPLREIIGLLKSARLFLGNDSGPAHMAAACRIPVAVLYGPSDPIVWAPWKAEAVQIVRDPISDITVDEVRSSLETLRVRA